LRIGNLRRCEGRRGCAEVDSVENLPVGEGDKACKIVDVGWRDLSEGVARAIGVPAGLVEGVAADAQDAIAEAVEHACERCVGSGEERIRNEGAFFV
jgi:hypothetical protein